MHALDQRGIYPLHAWGMTETSPLGSVGWAPAGLSGDEQWAYRYTQGRITAGVEARLVYDDGAVIPNDGQGVGELVIKGPWIAGSYYGGEGTDRFDGGWFRTGDVGSISPDGFLTLTDRAKDLIKSGGEWISSVELENLVMGHPDVKEAATIGIPDEKWSERPLVTVVLREDPTASMAELREYVSGKLAKWQIPENWARIEEIPKTSTGKFDKKRIRAQYADGGLQIERVG
jgi:fatty-acyl-CoA synthase